MRTFTRLRRPLGIVVAGSLATLGLALAAEPPTTPPASGRLPVTAVPASRSGSVIATPSVTMTATESAANEFQQAATCLAHGDQAGAATHLARQVAFDPAAYQSRLHLAELLVKLDRGSEAAWHYERFLATVPAGTPLEKFKIDCHTRLVAIAQARGDVAAEEFHRGVGLLLLVDRWGLPDSEADALLSEETAAQALAALTEAKSLAPSDARVRLMLARAYRVLHQPGAALACARQARQLLPDARLTEAEAAEVTSWALGQPRGSVPE